MQSIRVVHRESVGKIMLSGSLWHVSSTTADIPKLFYQMCRLCCASSGSTGSRNISFDFLIDGEFLRSSLEDYVASKDISTVYFFSICFLCCLERSTAFS